jgi:2-phosphosulfolactate phosphatase
LLVPLFVLEWFENLSDENGGRIFLNIHIYECIDGAKKATGLTVVIDVFRAFSTDCYVTRNGAETIIPVGDIGIAYKLKEEHPDYILMGERKGKIQPGFDFGNSPAQLEHVDFTGKTVVQTTSAGTQGIVNAVNASEIITGSLVNAKAIAKYIMAANPEMVSLVGMGNSGTAPAPEDTLCAEYIKSLLTGTPLDMDAAIASLKVNGAKRFFDPANADWSPEGDFYLSTALNRFDFVLKAEKGENGLFRLVKIAVG